MDDKKVGIRAPVGSRIFTSLFRADWLSYTMVTGRKGSPDVKRPGREGDHSAPTNGQVNKTWISTSISYQSSWRNA